MPNIEPDQMRKVLEDYSRLLAKTLTDTLPPGLGFALLVFSFGEGGFSAYISNAQREDMKSQLRELLGRLDAEAKPC